MKVITSFNSTPIVNKRWGQKDKIKDTIFINALGLLTLNEFFKDVTAYVDKDLYDVLKEFPCKVEKFNFSAKSDKYWVNSKFQVLGEQDGPFVHFDTDVFLKAKLTFNPLAQIIVERIEWETFEDHYGEQIEFFKLILPHLFNLKGVNPKYSVNCGTLGFTDIKLFREYYDLYREALAGFMEYEDNYKYYASKGNEPSIVIEQYLLTLFITHRGIFSPKLQLILNKKTDEENFALGNDMGYTHYSGLKKYEEINHIMHYFSEKYPYYFKYLNRKL